MVKYIATIYLQDASTKVWEETFDSKDLAEMALDNKLAGINPPFSLINIK